MAFTERPTNSTQTAFGTDRAGAKRCSIAINTPLGSASGIVLLDSSGVEYVMWVDSAGKVRVGTRAHWITPDAAGTVVGGQS